MFLVLHTLHAFTCVRFFSSRSARAESFDEETVRVRRALRLPYKKRILPGIQSAIELQESGESLALETKFYSSKRVDARSAVGDQERNRTRSKETTCLLQN